MKWFPFITIATIGSGVTGFDIVRDYSGQYFFNRWDFFGSWDNLTLGDVWWLNETQATSQGLAYINDANNAILKVDNVSTVAYGDKRNTVRITSQDAYALGSLWMIDVVHLPYGCSVWPAFWSKGPLWPDDGEIDIIEAVNVMPANQMALHTVPGCTHAPNTNELGTAGDADCSTASGCIVAETAPNSFESGFASVGGGVWACQFDVAGVFIWFWSRPNVPASITSANATSSIDISQWGPPSASYPSVTCNMTDYFTAQNLVLDITLCGDWAGIGPAYNATCGSSGPTGLCYDDKVVGPGSPTYDEAYFEISYVRAYTTGEATSTTSVTSTTTSTSSSASSSVTSTISEVGGMGGPTIIVTSGVSSSASGGSAQLTATLTGVSATATFVVNGAVGLGVPIGGWVGFIGLAMILLI